MGLNHRRNTIAVFTPFVSGFYLGEMCAQLQARAAQDNFDIIFIMTNSFNDYQQEISFELIDAALVILNAVSPALIQSLLDNGIPVVSTVDDYFPKPVEVIESNQRQGVERVFEHLYSLGHRKIGYVADMSIVDFRSRFDALQACYRSHQLSFDEDWLFRVNDPSTLGGAQAANEFCARRPDCTALIFAADQMAIGFSLSVKKRGISIPQDIAIVGVDNSRLSNTPDHQLTTVDQQIPELANRAIDRLLQRLNGAEYRAKHVIVDQQLVIRSSCGSIKPCAPLCSDEMLPAADMLDNDELAMACAGLGYEWIKTISNIWGPFFDWGCMAYNDTKDSQQLHLEEVFFDLHTKRTGAAMPQHCRVQHFPRLPAEDTDTDAPTMLTILPIEGDGHPWGVLSLVKQLHPECNQERYKMFAYYLVLMSFFMHREALADHLRQREQTAKAFAEHLEVVANTSNDGIWSWDLKANQVEWNSRSLDMLGFTSAEDQQAYGNMRFLERVHPQDKPAVKQHIKQHFEKQQAFDCTYRMQARNGNYRWVHACGETIVESDGSISRFVGALTDITESRRSREKINYLAYHDSLTGLLNRNALNQKVQALFTENPEQPYCLMLLDLNRFKLVNDSFGHPTGDELLRHVASSIQKTLRSEDIVARLGGDEFVIVTAMADNQQAMELAKRIHSRLSKSFTIHGNVFTVTASIGLSFYPGQADNYQALLHNADIAMYQAKSQHSAAPKLYHPGMHIDTKSEVDLEQSLRRAIEQQQLSFALQAQLDPSGQRLEGAEMLARWQHPELGDVSPGRFIPLAEQTGLINPLGNWILDQGIAWLARWQAQLPPSFCLSLNVSAVQLVDDKFVASALDKISSTGIAPEQLGFEVTETAAITDLAQTVEQLRKLAKLGCKIALDDFGTGYSSLGLITELPLTTVKIDRSFVQQLTQGEQALKVIQPITQMCHALGYQVVAEGVEQLPEVELLKQVGCDLIQGFYYAAPSSEQEFAKRYLAD
ncbi:EAL domain-containing protein [Aliagarivorans taiwanensis]|uniref:EAL domain-containing protein n=1 Tax=Aliagarivorans taiwanensis TaxID=561966 RepID=UPI0004142FAE|nr:EAL domain-containing protein [Aliagarivorans taiwanensis]